MIPTFRLDPAFARGPVDAMQCYCDLVGTTERIISNYQTDAEVRRAVKNTTLEMFSQDSASVQDWRMFLARLPVYFWSERTAALVAAASQSYPLEAEEELRLDDVKARASRGETVPPPSYWPRLDRALCVFEKPILVFDENGAPRQLSAIGWQIGLSVRRRSCTISLRGIAWSGSYAVPVWWSDGGTTGGPEFTGNDSKETFPSERLAFTKWVCTAAMFLEQEIILAHRVKEDRTIARRAKRELRLEQLPGCHVVMMRRAAPESVEAESSTGATDIEWAHRWMVRGHWRRQWFPKANGHAPIWIHPHVKGPDDKPFKEPSPTVFSVTR